MLGVEAPRHGEISRNYSMPRPRYATYAMVCYDTYATLRLAILCFAVLVYCMHVLLQYHMLQMECTPNIPTNIVPTNID